MPKPSVRSRNRTKTNPAILRRKRKASDADLELENVTNASISCDNSFDGATSSTKKSESVPSRSSFQYPYNVEILVASHPLTRPSTLPNFPWASSEDVWKNMVYKDITYIHDHKMFSHHSELEPRMRSVLLDWLIEVSEVYKLHRQTFYLAQDLIDRYLGARENVPKHQLQLLGITALFIAAKVEEIYPPKISEFAYVTDGACTEKEILHKELVILMTLDWQTSPMTVNSWLSVFLQVGTCSQSNNENFERQCFSGRSFSQICQVLDLCILDVNSLQFPYSVLASAAIAHLVSKDVALKVSGFKWIDIAFCVQWMTPFVDAIEKNGSVDPKYFIDIPACDRHSIQTHNIGLKLLEHAQVKQYNAKNNSPSSSAMGILTPPRSGKKINLK